MIQQCSRVFMLSFLFLDWTLCTSFQESRRRFVFPVCPFGEEWYCHPRCYCRPIHEQAVNGGWSEWSSSPCSATCGDGTKHETRSCTNPAPLHGGRNCEGDSVRVTPCHTGQCPTTTPIPTRCTSDVNCTGFNCPRQQYPFCEPNLEWSACGCTECTDDQHCSCTAGMIGHCRDVTFERKCECTPLPTTTPIPTKCTSDVNCTGFNCPKQQYPFCEPYLEWSACGCTECTNDNHCGCPTQTIPHCRDDLFERKCECKPLPGAACKSDLDCSTHVCTGNLSHSFCHENKFLVYDFSSCDCRECSKDSDCHCQSGLIPSCQASTFGNTCHCNQSNVTESSMGHTTSTPSSHSTPIRTTSVVKTSSPTTTTTTTTSTTTQTTKAATTSTTVSPAVSLNQLHESSTQPTHILTSTEDTKSTTDATTDSKQTLQSTKTTIPENNTSLIFVTLTTKPPVVRKCYSCGDSLNSIPCDTRAIYVGNVQDCGPGEDYCMTDLIHTGQTFPSIYKRCVTEDECRNKWLHQTSDLEHCTNYGNVLVEGHYSCHFCCTSDGCNSKQIPDKSTLYIKA
nr:integumentary mucin C.1 isoform X8 [Crassostrea gigas]